MLHRTYHFVTTPLLSAFIAVSSGAALANDADLFELSLEELMQIEVISANKRSERAFEIPAAVHVITSEDIRRSGATSIGEALRLSPGLHVAQIDSNKWAISARGFNRQYSNKLLVLIDGRTVYTPLYSGVFWDVQDTLLEDIERIEVIRGPGGTVWGTNAVNGVINIITKPSYKTQGSYLEVLAGNHEKLNVGGRYGAGFGDKGHFRTYAKRTQRDETRKLSDGLGANDAWYQERAGFRADWNGSAPNYYTSNQYVLQGDVYNGRNNWEFTTPSITTPPTENFQDDAELTGGNLMFKWQQEMGNESETNFQAYYDFVQRDMKVLGIVRHTLDLDFQRQHIISDDTDITWGGGYRYIIDRMEPSQWIDYQDSKDNTDLISGFIQGRTMLSTEENVDLTLGSKFEHNDYTGMEIQPSARVAWYPSKDDTVWASISRAVRIPSRNEDGIRLAVQSLGASFLTQQGNDQIDSEKLMAYEVGYRSRPINDWSFDTALFYHDYEELRTFEPDGTAVIPLGNKGSAESYGIEIASYYTMSSQWRLAGSYTFTRAHIHVDSSSTDSFTEADEEKSPAHQFSIRSYYNLPYDLQFDTMFYWYDNVQSFDIDNYAKLDLRLGWRPVEGLELSLAGQNLLDSYHHEFGENIYTAKSEIGQSVYLKAALNF